MDDYIALGRDFFVRALDVLGVRELDFLGVRSYWMGAVDSFEDLARWMSMRLSAMEPFTAAIGQAPSDVGWMYEYRGRDPEVIVRTGPMKVEQFLAQYADTDERDFYPEMFLFIDLDRILNDEAISAADAVADGRIHS